jgi:hypothetical protein
MEASMATRQKKQSKASATKRRGRPPKPRGQVKRSAIWFRVTDAKRAWLEKEAKAAGRSLAQQAEFFLEQVGFVADIGQIFGEASIRELGALRTILHELRERTERGTGRRDDWVQDHFDVLIALIDGRNEEGISKIIWDDALAHHFLRQVKDDLDENGLPRGALMHGGDPAVMRENRRHEKLERAIALLKELYPSILDEIIRRER